MEACGKEAYGKKEPLKPKRVRRVAPPPLSQRISAFFRSGPAEGLLANGRLAAGLPANGRFRFYLALYFSNQASIALAFAADCEGRAVRPPWDAPGTLTSPVSTPASCSAW